MRETNNLRRISMPQGNKREVNKTDTKIRMQETKPKLVSIREEEKGRKTERAQKNRSNERNKSPNE